MLVILDDWCWCLSNDGSGWRLAEVTASVLRAQVFRENVDEVLPHGFRYQIHH